MIFTSGLMVINFKIYLNKVVVIKGVIRRFRMLNKHHQKIEEGFDLNILT